MAISNPLSVKTSVYEGPLDLLLELIEKRKLLINDISLAAVADDFLAYISTHEELPVADTAEFISLAATLLLIKSRSLLPTLNISDEENRDIKELEYRLALYQLVKESAQGLRSVVGRAPMLYEGVAPTQEPLYIPDASATPTSLRAAVQNLIQGFPQIVALPKTMVRKIMSLEEVIEKLAGRVSSAMRLSFKEFSGMGSAATAEIKHSVIVSFLALLELVKQGTLRATQHAEFGDITLESDTVSTPTYE